MRPQVIYKYSKYRTHEKGDGLLAISIAPLFLMVNIPMTLSEDWSFGRLSVSRIGPPHDKASSLIGPLNDKASLQIGRLNDSATPRLSLSATHILKYHPQRPQSKCSLLKTIIIIIITFFCIPDFPHTYHLAYRRNGQHDLQNDQSVPDVPTRG